MHLKIEKLVKRLINTQYGEKTKVGVLHKGTWYSCFEGPQTKTWREGQEIEVEVRQNGNFWNIVFPKGNGFATEKVQEMADVRKELSEIKKSLEVIKQLLVSLHDENL